MALIFKKIVLGMIIVELIENALFDERNIEKLRLYVK
jgi:hypothetical protein